MHQPGRPPSNLAPNNVSMGLLGRSMPPMLMNNIPNSLGVLNLTSNGPSSFRDERLLENNDVGAFHPKRVKLSHNENLNYNEISPQHNNFPNIPVNKLNNYLINSNANLKHKNDAIEHYPGINLISLNFYNNNLKLINNHNPIPNISNNSTPPSSLPINIKPPLQINTSEIKKESAYTLQVEAISPTPPSDACKDDDIIKQHKEDILNNINRVDREIARIEQTVAKLCKKKDQLVEGQSKNPKVTQPNTPESSTTPSNHPPPSFSKQQSICQMVLAENQTKALQSHEFLRKLNSLPLFTKIVTGTVTYHLNSKNFSSFKPKLIACLKKRKQYEAARSRVLSKRYLDMLEVWNKKVEKVENSSKKKLNDAKLREVFEKAFPELKRKREDKERSTRLTTTGNTARNIKQEAEVEVDTELQEMNKRRKNAVVIPPLLSHLQRKKKWFNENGNLDNDLDLINMASMVNRCDYWTQEEKDVFKEKFISHPKRFATIASCVPTKNLNDCVLYYYGSKKADNYKQLLRRHHMSRRKTDKAKKAQSSKDVKEEKQEEMTDSKIMNATTATTTSSIITTPLPTTTYTMLPQTSTAATTTTQATSATLILPTPTAAIPTTRTTLLPATTTPTAATPATSTSLLPPTTTSTTPTNSISLLPPTTTTPATSTTLLPQKTTSTTPTISASFLSPTTTSTTPTNSTSLLSPTTTSTAEMTSAAATLIMFSAAPVTSLASLSAPPSSSPQSSISPSSSLSSSSSLSMSAATQKCSLSHLSSMSE